MDLDDLLDEPPKGPSGPSRPARFAPKGSKIKPRPKTEPSHSLPQSASEFVESLPVPKKEELAGKSDITSEYVKDAMEMDVEVKPAVKEEVREDLMEMDDMGAKGQLENDIVREIDVYFTPSVDPKTRLYVLQYPLRPLWRPYELDERCSEVRVKPATSEVQIDLAVDVDSKNYDSKADSKLHMEKQILCTTWKPPPSGGYAVGIRSGNQLHLTPIHAVVQLRTSMEHLDSRESNRKTGAPSNVEDAVKLEEPQEGKPSTSKKMSKNPEQTKDSGDEGWVPLKYHTARSDIAAGFLQKMVTCEGSDISFSMSSNAYLNSVCPGTSSGSSSSNGPIRRQLLTLPIKERFKTWLVQAPQLHRFDVLKHLAPDESDEEILDVLVEHARLVQGLWVPKSTLVYETDQGKEPLVRDYILLLFSKNVIIKESQIIKPLETEMKNVLNVLAVKRPDLKDWKLKELPDTSFIRRHPSVVKKQEADWKQMEKKINVMFFRGKNGPGMKTSSKSNVTNNPRTSESSNKVATRTANAATSGAAMPVDVREPITKALQKLFKSVKICSYQQISQRLRDMAVSESTQSKGFAKEAVAAANSIDAFPHELKAIISEVAVDIHGICVPKSSPDHPQYDAFRKIVIDLFLAEGPNAKLKKSTIIEAAKMELKREIPQNEYQKVLQELCLSQGSAWVLRSGDGKY